MESQNQEQVSGEGTNIKNDTETTKQNQENIQKNPVMVKEAKESEGEFKIRSRRKAEPKEDAKPKNEDGLQDRQQDNVKLQQGSKDSESGEKQDSGQQGQPSDGGSEVLETPVLEEIIDEPSNEEKQKEDNAEEGKENKAEKEVLGSKEPKKQEETKKEEPKMELPEGVDKLIKFMEETGGTVEDYAKLNTDYSKVDDTSLLKQYIKETKPHLDQEEIDFLIEDKYSFDEDVDDERDIKRKKLAYKEAVGDARRHFESMKEKYYNELKLGSKLTPEQKEAVEFYQQYQREQSEQSEQAQLKGQHFEKLTNSLFNEEFKGFEFNVKLKDGESKRFRYNVDKDSVRDSQMDVNGVLSKYLDPQTGMLKDAESHHKGLFAYQNPDALAQHFYEQGRTDAIKNMDMNAKNINMDRRKVQDGKIPVKGVQVKVVGGEDSSQFKIKKSRKFIKT